MNKARTAACLRHQYFDVASTPLSVEAPGHGGHGTPFHIMEEGDQRAALSRTLRPLRPTISEWTPAISINARSISDRNSGLADSSAREVRSFRPQCIH